MIKKDFCVSKEIEEFFDDYESSNKKWKLLTKFSSSDLDFKSKDINVDKPKRKKVFKAKVKVYKKNKENTKNIF